VDGAVSAIRGEYIPFRKIAAMIARKNRHRTTKQNFIDLKDLVFLVARRAHVPDTAIVAEED